MNNKAIWTTKELSLEKINQLGNTGLGSLLKIKITHITEDSLTAQMPVSADCLQPFGKLHGGAHCVLAETLGSIASNLCLENAMAVGKELHAHHLRPVTEGILTAVAHPLHMGKSSHLWEIKIYDQQQHLVNVTNLTTAIIK